MSVIQCTNWFKGRAEGIGRTSRIKRTSFLSSTYNFPAERRDIQYEAAQRQVERLRPGVPVKPYSGFSRYRGGLDSTQSSMKDSCSFEPEV
jgi:hypothetical protein